MIGSDPEQHHKRCFIFINGQSLSYSPDGIQEFKMRFVRTEVLESWLFYRQIFQDFAAIATKFSRFT